MGTAAIRARWAGAVRCLRVGPLTVDLALRRVLRPDGETELPQRFFDLLLLFLAEPEVVHSRASLLERVWSGVIVEDANLSQAVLTLRKALGEDRRGWIRTVAKSGYLFQPGVPVEPVAETSCAVQVATAVAPAPPRPAGAAGGPRPSRWLGAAVLLVSGLLVLLTVLDSRRAAPAIAAPGLAASVAGTAPMPVTAGPLVVGLLQLGESGDAGGQSWPATLLRAWCEWTLQMHPQVVLLRQDQLAQAGLGPQPTHLVLISAVQADEQPERWFVQITLKRPGQNDWRQRIASDVQGLPAALGAMADGLLAALPLAHRPAAWPQLELDGRAAPEFARFIEARDAREWSKAAELGQALVAQAPTFVPLRLELAAVLSRLGQVNAAMEHAQLALPQLSRLPAASARVLAAQLASWQRDPQQALLLNAALAADFPQQPAFGMEQARALLALDRAGDALPLLEAIDWTAQPPAIRTLGWLLRAQAQRQLGDGRAAQASAQTALKLSQRAGWKLETGLAQFQWAAAAVITNRALPDGAGFAAAIASFESAGDALRAQEARLHALTTDRGDSAQVDRELAVLLARARSAGHRGLEIDALRMVAFRNLRTGDPRGYRERLEEAAAVAAAAGDRLALSRMDLYLLPIDLDRGLYARAEERLARLKPLALQGEAGFWATQFEQWLAFRRGDFARVEHLLGDGMPLLADTATVQALRQCNRAQLALVRAQLDQARSRYASCRQSPALVYQLHALAGLARLDLVIGDRDAALLHLGEFSRGLAGLGGRTDQLALELELAELLLRAGELDVAAALYQRLTPEIRHNDQPLLEAESALGLARIAVARGQWDASTRLVATARPLIPADDWGLSLTLGLFDALAQRRLGAREAASQALAGLEQRARSLGDRLALAEILALADALALDVPCCDAAARAALVGESGLRGVRWELAGL